MGGVSALPTACVGLEGLVDRWAVDGLAARAQRRGDSTADERQALYDALNDIAPAALAELDRKPIAQPDAAEQTLLQLLLGYAHVAMAVEIRGDGEAAHARQSRFMVILL